MTLDETIDLLTVAAAFDRRTLGEGDAVAWHSVVGDLDFADARAAVVGHYADSREWIMPADVRTRVKRIRRDRIEREILTPPPAELTDQASNYQRVLQQRIREIADGKQVLRAIGPVPSETPPDIAELREKLGPALPPRDSSVVSLQERARQQAAASRTVRAAGESAS